MDNKKSKWKINKIKYDIKYVRETYKRYELRLRVKNDSDMIKFLDSKDNKNEYIKKLIEEDMIRNYQR